MNMLRDLIELLGLTPAHVLALTLGLALSWAITQSSKQLVELLHGKRATLLAAVVAWTATYTIAPPAGIGWRWDTFWLATFAAFASPAAYKAVIAISERFFPRLAKALSGDPK